MEVSAAFIYAISVLDAALYVIPPIVNSAAVQELPSELVAVARDWLDSLRPEKEEMK